MAPFLTPRAVLTSFRDRAESIVIQGDRLYIGTSTGSLHIYSVDNAASIEDGEETLTLIELKKNFTRRAIEQLGFVRDINSLVVLSDSVITLYPVPSLTPATPLTKAKAAFSFSISTSIRHLPQDGNNDQSEMDFATAKAKMKPVPTLMTQLVVGCRRKVVIYTWKDGEAQEAKEATLPHSPRMIAFLDSETLCLGYSPTEYVLFSIPILSAKEIPSIPSSSSLTGVSAFSGLTGYMTLGLGAKPKPMTIQLRNGEAMIAKDNEGIIVGVDAKPTRSNTIGWHTPPEDIAFVNPYIFAIFPPGSVPIQESSYSPPASGSPPSNIQNTSIQIYSSISLLPRQTLVFPFKSPVPSSASITTPQPNAIVRLLTPSPTSNSPLYFITTPIDRTAATMEGSTIWQVCMISWAEQLDEMVLSGHYDDALALLDIIDTAALPDKEKRRYLIRALRAVTQFSAKNFDEAINTFSELNINPAKVVALYPEVVAGRLSIPPEEWIPLFGGPTTSDDHTPTTSAESPSIHDDLHRSVEVLVRYLSDHRPKVDAALASVNITPATQPHETLLLSKIPVHELFSLPNAPLSSLTPEQLIRFAQIVYTALFKSYLVIRPGLLGPLCRVPNWCEVSEVEEELQAREKFAELIDLYHGKKMHSKAFALLRRLSDRETNMADKLGPTISYLQKLGPEHIDQVFEASRWVFEQDQSMALEIFTSEDVELPREAVVNYLDSIDPQICIRYLEYLISERSEESPVFHDRLAELYLKTSLLERKRGNESLHEELYGRLLHFIHTTQHYRVDRLYGLISSEDLFEARAILLGRLGRHDQALELYVYRLHDYVKAEDYCKRVYQPDTETSNVFLTLLRTYLQPTMSTDQNLLRPALDLISRQSPRLDAIETLNLLPPLVTAQDLKTFFLEALRAPIFDNQVIRQISKARNEQLARRLMSVQSKRVRVTDSRICPQCHKRIGNSVIAVHVPRGEVTHYQCREAFSHQLNDMRR